MSNTEFTPNLKISVRGAIKKIYPEKAGDYPEQKFLVEWQNDNGYEETMCFTAKKKSLEYMNNYAVGDVVEVSAYIKHRTWSKDADTDYQFFDANVAYMKKAEAVQAQTTNAGTTNASAPVQEAELVEDDLPF